MTFNRIEYSRRVLIYFRQIFSFSGSVSKDFQDDAAWLNPMHCSLNSVAFALFRCSSMEVQSRACTQCLTVPKLGSIPFLFFYASYRPVKKKYFHFFHWSENPSVSMLSSFIFSLSHKQTRRPFRWSTKVCQGALRSAHSLPNRWFGTFCIRQFCTFFALQEYFPKISSFHVFALSGYKILWLLFNPSACQWAMS